MVNLCPSFKECSSALRERSWSRRVATIVIVTIMLAIVLVILGLLIAIHLTDTCIEVGLPSNVTINSFSDVTRITWNHPEEQRNCYVYYALFYRIDAGEKVSVPAVHSLYYEIPRLKACSILNIQIHGVSGSSGELTETYVVHQYKEIPVEVPPPVITYDIHKEGIVVEWKKPAELEKCRIHYMLDIETDFGHRRKYTIIQEYFILQSSTYCFQIYLNIATIYHDKTGPVSSTRLVLPEEVLELQTELNDTTVIVNWRRHSKHVLCSLSYTVVYEREGQEPITNEVKKPTTSFDITYCLYGSITLSVSYANKTYSSSVNASYWPDEIEGPSNLNITVNETICNATWEMQELLGYCKFNYHIQVISDIGNFNHTMKMKMRASIFKIFSPRVTSDTFALATHSPDKFQALASQYMHTLRVSWQDKKWKTCNLTYSLTYTVGNVTDKMEVDGFSKAFDLDYCTNATIGIQSHDSAPPSKEIFIVHEEGNPIRVGRVQNITVTVVEDTSTIKWNPPKHVQYCEPFMYNVTGIGPDGSSASCNGTENCQIKMNNFCPQTTFQITSITYPGSPVATYEHKCP
ncbi:hypothetical protein QE152_g39708 [Popillia japonica]|uniref:Uncharacterized protein n=1 Tax=Popillia japonica TaxID=7064 RepID=A0AAW1HU32_POPJA